MHRLQTIRGVWISWYGCMMLLPVITYGCPTNCFCQSTIVDCGNRALTAVPSDHIPVTTTVLYLDGNAFNSQLSLEHVPDLPQLQYLYLNNSGFVGHILEESFHGFPNLQMLYLSDNRFTYINQNAFQSLSLHHLNIDGNTELVDLSRRTFRNTRVSALSIDECSFSALPPALFRDIIPHLQTLSISHNSQRLNIPPDTLRGASLSRVTLEYSNIVSFDFLQGLQIQLLNVNGNYYGTGLWNVVATITGVEQLSMNNNNLTVIQATTNMLTVTHCDLSHNSISFVVQSDLQYFENIISLNLSHNHISDIPYSLWNNLRFLQTLDLSNNDIRTLDSDTFLGLNSLVHLNISANPIEVLPSNLQETFSRLRVLQMYNLQLHCVCSMLWLQDWVSTHQERVEILGATCTEPVSLPIVDMSISDFSCTAPYIEEFTITTSSVSCSATGEPLPNVVLLNFTSESNAQYVQTTNLVRITYDTTSLACLPHGVYICRASNAIGSANEMSSINSEHQSACVTPTTPANLQTTSAEPAAITTQTTTPQPTTTTPPTTPTSHVIPPPTSSTLPIHPQPITTSVTNIATSDPSDVTTNAANDSTAIVQTTDDFVGLPRKKTNNSTLSSGAVAAIIIAVMIVCVFIVIGAIFLFSRYYNKTYSVNNNEMPTVSGHVSSSNGQNGTVPKSKNKEPERTYIHYTLEDIQC